MKQQAAAPPTLRRSSLLLLPPHQQAALDAREAIVGCFEVLQPQLAAIDPSLGWQDYLWAVQVLHSRCFYEPSSRRHLAVPAVDMCNHDARDANAAVRIVHSPAACQGLGALEEVAPEAAAAVAAGTSYFQLVVGAWPPWVLVCVWAHAYTTLIFCGG